MTEREQSVLYDEADTENKRYAITQLAKHGSNAEVPRLTFNAFVDRKKYEKLREQGISVTSPYDVWNQFSRKEGYVFDAQWENKLGPRYRELESDSTFVKLQLSSGN